jgi:hypothetical protein
MAADKRAINARVSPATYEQLVELATREERPIASLLRLALREYLAARAESCHT